MLGGAVCGHVADGVARRELCGEVDLLDRVSVHERDQVEEVDQPVDRVQVVVGLSVLAEDPQQPVAVGQQLPLRVLVLGPADEVLLAGVADDVVVGVPEADEGEGLGPAELLVARLDVDARVVGGGRVVVVAVVDVGVDATDRVDQVLEAAEVDVDYVVDDQAGEDLLAQRLDQQVGPAQRVGGVQLGDSSRHREPDLKIARDREHVDGRGVRVKPNEHHRVGVGRVPRTCPRGDPSRQRRWSASSRGSRSSRSRA